MPYIITKSNGKTLTTVADGSIDNSTSLTFVGRNYAGYGAILDQNLFYLLENFSKSSSPKNPVQGQLWFDSTNLKLNVYDGLTFKPLSFTSTAKTQPNNSTTGDFWFNPNTNQLSINYGGTFINVSGSGSSGGSSSVLATVKDNSNVSHLVLKSNINTNTVYLSSVDTPYSVNISDTIYSSFSYIGKGISLPGADANGKTATTINDGYLFFGSASDALRADSLSTFVNTLEGVSYYSASDGSVPSTIVARDPYGNIYAQTLYGVATSANALLVNNSTYQTAVTSSTANTIAARDSSGNLRAANFIGGVSSATFASSAGSLSNGITFNSSGAGVTPGTVVNAATSQIVSFNSVGAIGLASFTGASNQKLTTTSGWQKMPGGMIIAWGYQTVTYSSLNDGTVGQGSVALSFGGAPFTTPPSCVNATLGLGNLSNTGADWWTQILHTTITTSGCSIYIQSSGTAGNYYTGFHWMAIGY
jgi:hypothetical protein